MIINGDEENFNNEKYKEIIENHWKWKCMFHNESFNRRYRYYRLIFEEKDPFTKEHLEHLVCFTCKKEKIEKIEKKEGKKTVKCDFCDGEHTIIDIKNVTEDNENESNCLIV
jgi:hypothetical protein